MLTWRSGRALEAAYLGECRVGYVAETARGFLWNTSLLRPTGGQYLGRCETKEAAHAELEAAVQDWIDHAGLSTNWIA